MPMPIDLLELPLPVTLRAVAPVSDEELMRLSACYKPYRIERNREGEITIMTPAGGVGGNQEFLISAAFVRWMDAGADGISFSPSTGFHLPDGSCLSPDGSWISQERWETLTPEQQKSYPPLCPDFLIEVRSQSDSRRSVEEKMQLWMDNGAKLAWLIDPIECSVTIYREGAAQQKLLRPNAVEGDPLIEGFLLRTSRLWDTL
jgi:Uma2 family endonuclease